MRTVLIVLAGLLTSCSSINKEESGALNNEEGPYVVKEGQTPPPAVVSYDNYRDPLESINRPIFWFNDVAYRYALTPISKGYEKVVPKPVDRSVRNFFFNLREPLHAINYLLQGKITKSGQSIARLLLNSTMGILGLFDPAQGWLKLEKNKTTLGDTLAYHGVGYGFYVVIPLLGPSNVRDGLSMSLEYYGHPVHFVQDDKGLAWGLLFFEGLVEEVPRVSKYTDVVADAKDPYAFIRDFYMQNKLRDNQALRGEKFE